MGNDKLRQNTDKRRKICWIGLIIISKYIIKLIPNYQYNNKWDVKTK